MAETDTLLEGSDPLEDLEAIEDFEDSSQVREPLPIAEAPNPTLWFGTIAASSLYTSNVLKTLRADEAFGGQVDAMLYASRLLPGDWMLTAYGYGFWRLYDVDLEITEEWLFLSEMSFDKVFARTKVQPAFRVFLGDQVYDDSLTSAIQPAGASIQQTIVEGSIAFSGNTFGGLVEFKPFATHANYSDDALNFSSLGFDFEYSPKRFLFQWLEPGFEFEFEVENYDEQTVGVGVNADKLRIHILRVDVPLGLRLGQTHPFQLEFQPRFEVRKDNGDGFNNQVRAGFHLALDWGYHSTTFSIRTGWEWIDFTDRPMSFLGDDTLQERRESVDLTIRHQFTSAWEAEFNYEWDRFISDEDEDEWDAHFVSLGLTYNF